MGADLMDRRKDLRATIGQEARFKLLGNEENIAFGYESAQTKNISKSGVCIYIPHTIKEGNVVRVEIPVTIGEIKKQIKAFCEVQWCREAQEKKGSYEAGLSFIAVKEDDVDLLHTYVNRIDAKAV
jgi:hypothetical protein